MDPSNWLLLTFGEAELIMGVGGDLSKAWRT